MQRVTVDRRPFGKDTYGAGEWEYMQEDRIYGDGSRVRESRGEAGTVAAPLPLAALFPSNAGRGIREASDGRRST